MPAHCGIRSMDIRFATENWIGWALGSLLAAMLVEVGKKGLKLGDWHPCPLDGSTVSAWQKFSRVPWDLFLPHCPMCKIWAQLHQENCSRELVDVGKMDIRD